MAKNNNFTLVNLKKLPDNLNSISPAAGTDLDNQKLLGIVKDMRKAFLFLHSPQDEIVGIDNAAELYQAAHHPKSYVSLDGADHLLTKEKDACYAGDVIANWAKRYGQKGREIPTNSYEDWQQQILKTAIIPLKVADFKTQTTIPHDKIKLVLKFLLG